MAYNNSPTGCNVLGKGGEGVVYTGVLLESDKSPRADDSNPQMAQMTQMIAYKHLSVDNVTKEQSERVRSMATVSNSCRNSVRVTRLAEKDDPVGGTRMVQGIVMPLYRHGDIVNSIRTKSLKLDAYRIADIVLGVSKFLSDLHNDHNVYHRDIKPANILLACGCSAVGAGHKLKAQKIRDIDSIAQALKGVEVETQAGMCDCLRDVTKRVEARVCDFSLSRPFRCDGIPMHTSANLAGTLAYVATERIQHVMSTMSFSDDDTNESKRNIQGTADNVPEIGVRHDRAAGAKDIYALGVVLWELLYYARHGTYRTFFTALAEQHCPNGSTICEIVKSHFDGNKPSLDVPPVLAPKERQRSESSDESLCYVSMCVKPEETELNERLVSLAEEMMGMNPMLRPTAAEVENLLSDLLESWLSDH